MLGTADTVNEQGIFTCDKDICNKAQMVWGGPLALLYFPERQTKVLKEAYTLSEELPQLLRAP